MELGELTPATFVERLNRFVCLVNLNNKLEKVLIRNTGRLKELLTPGREVYLRYKEGGKYRHELLLVRLDKTLVCVDSHLPPKLLVEYALKTGYPWKPVDYKYEFRVGTSRLDLLINKRILVETKSVNLVIDGTAMFPDAPTTRGSKHIEELIRSADTYKPEIVFIVQREDALRFTPNKTTDPVFSEALKRFSSMGFTVRAFVCRVNLEEITIKEEIPVIY